MIVPHYDWEVLREGPVGLGIFRKTLSQQMAFIDWIEQIEWNVTDEGRTSAFYILFSKNQTEIDTYLKFARGPHEMSTVFAVNPPISPQLAQMLEFNLSETILIADGRLFKSVSEQQLVVIDKWAKHQIFTEINRTMNRITYKRSLAMIYFSCIAVDWKGMKINRHWMDPDVWELKSPLIHISNSTSMHWDILMNPFSREYQRIADIISYVDRKGIASVRMVAVPPMELSEPLTTYYRMALEKDQAEFTMLNDTTTYSSMPDMPDSWIFESMKAVFDLDNILLMELTPSKHEGKYVLTGIKADGVIRACNIQIYGSRKADRIDSVSGKRPRAHVGTVSADDHKAVDSVLMADIRALLLAFLRLEFHAARRSQNRAASLNDIGNASRLHIYDLFI